MTQRHLPVGLVPIPHFCPQCTNLGSPACLPALRRTFILNRERAVDYLNTLDRIYVFDGYAG